jgi:predicted nucleic acid-binding protein
MRSAFQRRLRDGALTAAELNQLHNAFRSDCLNEYQIFPVNQPVIELAGDLIERHALRTLDAIQLATALTAQRFLVARGFSEVGFIAADDRLLQTAIAEGLAIDNPNLHPL